MEMMRILLAAAFFLLFASCIEGRSGAEENGKLSKGEHIGKHKKITKNVTKPSRKTTETSIAIEAFQKEQKTNKTSKLSNDDVSPGEYLKEIMKDKEEREQLSSVAKKSDKAADKVKNDPKRLTPDSIPEGDVEKVTKGNVNTGRKTMTKANKEASKETEVTSKRADKESTESVEISEESKESPDKTEELSQEVPLVVGKEEKEELEEYEEKSPKDEKADITSSKKKAMKTSSTKMSNATITAVSSGSENKTSNEVKAPKRASEVAVESQQWEANIQVQVLPNIKSTQASLAPGTKNPVTATNCNKKETNTQGAKSKRRKSSKPMKAVGKLKKSNKSTGPYKTLVGI